MIRTSQLHGMSVVDVDSATKLGEVDELFLDVERQMITGISVSRGGTLLSGDERLLLPVDAIQSFGEDVVMVRSGYLADGIELNTRASGLAGRPIVTESGTHLGAVDEILFDEHSRRVIGYAFAERGDSKGSGLGGLFGIGRRHEGHDHGIVDYVRADAGMRFGDLILVPDSSVVRNQKIGDARLTEGTTVLRTPPATT